MIDVAVNQMEFQQQFKSPITSCLLQTDANVNVSKFESTINLVYQELSHKLCRTCLGEFISAHSKNLLLCKGNLHLPDKI